MNYGPGVIKETDAMYEEKYRANLLKCVKGLEYCATKLNQNNGTILNHFLQLIIGNPDGIVPITT